MGSRREAGGKEWGERVRGGKNGVCVESTSTERPMANEPCHKIKCRPGLHSTQSGTLLQQNVCATQSWLPCLSHDRYHPHCTATTLLCLARPRRPARPLPKSTIDPGSGTAVSCAAPWRLNVPVAKKGTLVNGWVQRKIADNGAPRPKVQID